MQKATGSYRTHLSLATVQPWFPSLQWKTAFGQNCGLGSCVCRERPALGQNTDDDQEKRIRRIEIYVLGRNHNLFIKFCKPIGLYDSYLKYNVIDFS